MPDKEGFYDTIVIHLSEGMPVQLGEGGEAGGDTETG